MNDNLSVALGMVLSLSAEITRLEARDKNLRRALEDLVSLTKAITDCPSDDLDERVKAVEAWLYCKDLTREEVLVHLNMIVRKPKAEEIVNKIRKELFFVPDAHKEE